MKIYPANELHFTKIANNNASKEYTTIVSKVSRAFPAFTQIIKDAATIELKLPSLLPVNEVTINNARSYLEIHLKTRT